MKLFSILVMTMLLLQAFVEVSTSLSDGPNSTARMGEGSAVVAINKKPHRPKINCNHACSNRCKKSSRKKICKRACKSCCIRCHCVPPGTYGHTHACPCYARLRTHGNKLKCP